MQAFAARHGFSTTETPWNMVSEEVRDMFYYGDSEPLKVTYRSKSGRVYTRETLFVGFYGWVRDWDIGGTYTDNIPLSNVPRCTVKTRIPSRQTSSGT